MVLYSAMSEWIRMITFDVDPILGSNKTGVTRAYLEERAAAILIDLANALSNVYLEKTRAFELVSWMINQMLTIGELWEPVKNQLICMPKQFVCVWNGLVRVTGVRSSTDVGIAQVGICHYRAASENEVKLESERQQIDNYVTKTYPLFSKGPGDFNKIAKNFSSTSDCSLGIATTYSIKENHLTDRMRYFILSCGWPKSKITLNWDKAEEWLIPNASFF